MTLNDLPKKWRQQVELAPGKVNKAAAVVAAGKLRYEARLAHLDGRTAQAKKYNRYADCVARAVNS